MNQPSSTLFEPKCNRANSWFFAWKTILLFYQFVSIEVPRGKSTGGNKRGLCERIICEDEGARPGEADAAQDRGRWEGEGRSKKEALRPRAGVPLRQSPPPAGSRCPRAGPASVSRPLPAFGWSDWEAEDDAAASKAMGLRVHHWGSRPVTALYLEIWEAHEVSCG